MHTAVLRVLSDEICTTYSRVGLLHFSKEHRSSFSNGELGLVTARIVGHSWASGEMWCLQKVWLQWQRMGSRSRSLQDSREQWEPIGGRSMATENLFGNAFNWSHSSDFQTHHHEHHSTLIWYFKNWRAILFTLSLGDFVWTNCHARWAFTPAPTLTRKSTTWTWSGTCKARTTGEKAYSRYQERCEGWSNGMRSRYFVGQGLI